MKTFLEYISKYYTNDINEADSAEVPVNDPSTGKESNSGDNDAAAVDAASQKDDNKIDVVNNLKDSQNSEKYFFKNILFFTNEDDASKNKTLKNLEDAVKGKDVTIYKFISEDVEYKSTNDFIEIKDKNTKYKIDEQSNIDTIVIVRLGAQDSEECMECIKELQEWGLFVINPIQAAKRASNKYASSVLMERYEIPQPKFALLSASDIEKGMESLSKKLKLIYKDAAEETDETKKYEYVVKILDGHGGTGVFMVNGKTILSILQAIFAIDPERELLLQKKEEADGGDIRVHVLTSRTKQSILAAMKRVKISGDFRSNVSLGAQAEKVELTDEQKEIALKVAKISGMPWCAVDIMPLVKGSNPEIGDNVVLEYNASPGTDGISEVIGENFCKILLDAINDINELVLAPKSIGYIENIKLFLDDDDELEMECKLDTGNGSHASTIGCDSIEVIGDKVIAVIEGKKHHFHKHGVSNAIVGQVTEPRTTVLIPCIQIGTRKLLDAEFALVDNRNKSTKILLNRDLMSKMGYLINPALKHSIEDEFRSTEFKKERK